jgi:hypothetical protein
MSARRRTLAVAAAGAALVAACSDLRMTTAVNTIEVAIADPSWRFDIAPVLNETCASSGACHGGANPANGMNLEAGQSYANVVNVASVAFPQFMRVRPGQPDSSFLYLATSPVVAERQGYFRMPLTEYPLPDPVRQTIRNWIADGAPDN